MAPKESNTSTPSLEITLSSLSLTAPSSSSSSSTLNSAPRLPPEIWHSIFSCSNLPSNPHLTPSELKERYKFFNTICLISKNGREVAQPLLFERVSFTWNTRKNLRKLLSTLIKNVEKCGWIKKFELNLDPKEEVVDQNTQEVILAEVTAVGLMILARCQELEELVLEGLPNMGTLPLALEMVSMSLRQLVLKDVTCMGSVFHTEFPHLQSLILYDVEVPHDLYSHPERFPNLEEFVYFNNFPATINQSSPVLPRLKYLARPHKISVPDITSLDPDLTILHFIPPDYCRIEHINDFWDLLNTHNDKHIRFQIGPPSPSDHAYWFIRGRLVRMLDRPEIVSIGFPPRWLGADEMRDDREILRRGCEQRDIDLVFEERNCEGLEYFLNHEWWKVPRKDTTRVQRETYEEWRNSDVITVFM